MAFFHPKSWGYFLVLFILSGLTSCATATPPLPATSSSPALSIAVLSPTSGELATYGRAMRNGILMAFDAWNNQGGVLDHRLEWVLYDTDCTFESARLATQQAVEGGHQFIIGPICSEATIASAVQAQGQALIFAPAATHPLVTRTAQGQPRAGVFRISYSYGVQGRAAARFALNTLNAKNAAILFNPGDDYSRSLAQAFRQDYTNNAGKIVYQNSYSLDTADFMEMLTEASESGAEVIYLPSPASIANRVADQLKGLDFPDAAQPLLLGSDSWNSDNLDISATQGSYFPVHYSVEYNVLVVQNWAESYKSAYAVEPTVLAALGYDAANILAQALQQADTFELSKVNQVLENNSFEAVTGALNFDDLHNPLKPVHFIRVQDGLRYEATIILPTKFTN